MGNRIRIAYLEHSAFAVDSNETMLIFDYARGAPPEGANEGQGYITPAFLERYKRVYVFVSHGHGDHYERGIFDWRGHPGIEYILGYDIADAPAGRRMSPGDTAVFGNLSVTAHASTDIGVSFLIDWTETGYRVFHAGDLNLWHWRDESTLREIEQAERSFYDAVAPLVGSPADVAFFPVDPRQGALYDAGATYFIAQTQPRFFIPMHWQGRADVAMDFARRAGEKRTRIIALTTPGETIAIEKGENDESEALRTLRAEPLGETLENRNIITEG